MPQWYDGLSLADVDVQPVLINFTKDCAQENQASISRTPLRLELLIFSEHKSPIHRQLYL